MHFLIILLVSESIAWIGTISQPPQLLLLLQTPQMYRPIAALHSTLEGDCAFSSFAARECQVFPLLLEYFEVPSWDPSFLKVLLSLHWLHYNLHNILCFCAICLFIFSHSPVDYIFKTLDGRAFGFELHWSNLFFNCAFIPLCKKHFVVKSWYITDSCAFMCMSMCLEHK